MIDMTETERKAILHAGQMGGEYLDELRITDLYKLSQGQYETYVRCVVSAYLGEIARLAHKSTSPLPF